MGKRTRTAHDHQIRRIDCYNAMTQHLPLKVALYVSLTFIIGYVLIGLWTWGNTNQVIDSVGQISQWCERVHLGLFREPVNALSNLGFMLAGLYMFYTLKQDPENVSDQNRFRGYTPISILYASTVIWLGPGSMLMHGTQTFWGGWADNLSMIMYIVLPWLINVGEMGRWSQRRLLTSYFFIIVSYGLSRWFLGGQLGIGLDLWSLSIALWGISEFLYRFWSPSARWLSGLLGFAIALVFGITPAEMLEEPGRYWWVILFWVPALIAKQAPEFQRSYVPWYIIGNATFIIAFMIWLRGKPGDPWCNPDSLFQLHGAWHLLGAWATWCFFKFFRTAKRIKVN